MGSACFAITNTKKVEPTQNRWDFGGIVGWIVGWMWLSSEDPSGVYFMYNLVM